MNRLVVISVAALLTSSGLALAQDKSTEKPKGDSPIHIDNPPPAKTTAPDKKDAKTLELGSPAPALNIEKWVKGEPVASFQKGKVYVVEFWATWCQPCRVSMPHLTGLQKEYKDKGLTIIGVASPGWRDELSDVEKMVGDKSSVMGYTIAWDKEVPREDGKEVKNKAAKRGYTNELYMVAAGQDRIPTSFVIDGAGNLAWYGHPMELDYVIDDVIAGKWDVKEGPAKVKEMRKEFNRLFKDAQDDPKGTLVKVADFEKKYPRMNKELARAKFSLALQADAWDEASKSGGQVVDQLIAAQDSQGLNELAWLIVDPQGEIHGTQLKDLAMKAATKGVEFTESKDGAILDTLARCYYLKGDKARAIELQKKAISVLTKEQAEEMKDQLEETLKEYEGGSN